MDIRRLGVGFLTIVALNTMHNQDFQLPMVLYTTRMNFNWCEIFFALLRRLLGDQQLANEVERQFKQAMYQMIYPNTLHRSLHTNEIEFWHDQNQLTYKNQKLQCYYKLTQS